MIATSGLTAIGMFMAWSTIKQKRNWPFFKFAAFIDESAYAHESHAYDSSIYYERGVTAKWVTHFESDHRVQYENAINFQSV